MVIFAITKALSVITMPSSFVPKQTSNNELSCFYSRAGWDGKKGFASASTKQNYRQTTTISIPPLAKPAYELQDINAVPPALRDSSGARR